MQGLASLCATAGLYGKQSLKRFGLWLQSRRRLIQWLQWGVVLFYFTLLIIPACMDLPPREAGILHNMALFSQFIFWGIWWPFVILSMLLVGRMAWCGTFCPEGALAEWSSRFGMNKTIPRWLKWRGWPTVAFTLTTLYGQLISVYDYARSALLILGGSTVAAMLVGLCFGRGTRVWCRYLCPVNGVFNLLSRLAPISFKTNQRAWNAYSGSKPENPQCPPMINIHRLNGVSACHMCGRCAGFRNAVALEARSPNEEILRYGAQNGTEWNLRLLLYGMIGIAIGAFTWTANPCFITFYQNTAAFLIERNLIFLLNDNAPWFILTNMPQNNDAFTWAYGGCIVFYVLGCGLLFGSWCEALLGGIGFISGKGKAFKLHLAQALLPLAAAGLFLGLTATTIKILGYSGIRFSWVSAARFAILSGGALWSLYLGWKLLLLCKQNTKRLIFCFSLYCLCLVPIITAWYFMFWGW